MPVLAAPLEALAAFGQYIAKPRSEAELTVRRLHPHRRAGILYHPKHLERASFHKRGRPSGYHSKLVCTAWGIRRVIRGKGRLDTPRDRSGWRGSRNAYNRNPLGGPITLCPVSIYLYVTTQKQDFIPGLIQSTSRMLTARRSNR